MLFTVRTVKEFEQNLKSSIACENKTNLGGFQVQSVIFSDCPTMIALDFCTKSYSCFKSGLFMCQKVKSHRFGLIMYQQGLKTCASYNCLVYFVKSLSFRVDFCHVEFS